VRYGFNLPNFGEFHDVRALAELAAAAEAGGWDGFFIWDHLSPIFEPGAIVPTADVTVALTAIALATESIRFGTMVTPLPRRRVQKVAREWATLDQLSNGRAILGDGLGEPPPYEYEAFGENGAVWERARRLDESLTILDGFWKGERVDFDGDYLKVHSEPLLPTPVQQPRIPIWVAARWPGLAGPYKRAARWDGVFPIAPNAMDDFIQVDDIARIKREVGRDDDFEIVVNPGPGADPAAFAEAGATWWIETYFDHDKALARAKKGPPR
jgi:alkanesulfonate monooxygenase SsuD/methylene tetrahydromethanopterin reductase-like flavin-dependent oxidoreductase (luciferase family)